ncbi:MAG: signal peptidase I [Deferribacteres bacterium]|nr:signal peptidase I [candidate division KSB1 bacterium]MCB9504006.1 signal peptidase I [Deferribacteres bacterium]
MRFFSKDKDENKTKSKVRETVESLLVAVFAVMILRSAIVQAYHVPTGSMKNTVLIGDFLLVNKFIYGARTPDSIPFLNYQLPHLVFPALKNPEPGEIVVFKYPPEPNIDYVKRCIATGGQVVEIKNGDVFIDGKPEGKKRLLRKQYDPEEQRQVLFYEITRENGKRYVVRHYENHNLANENYGPEKVEKNHYFMMGDNRDNSSDSRFWGFVPRENVVGEAMLIYWSWNKFLPLYKLPQKVRWNRIGSFLE